jgi:predicted RNA-binding protein YlqC (UPF0109 family)
MELDLFSVKTVEKELSINLTDDQAGKLIGRGGKNIENMRKRFNGVDIDINRYGQRVVKIRGSRRVCVYGLILTQIL